MRQFSTYLLFGTLLLSSGCHPPWMQPGPSSNPPAPTISKEPTAAELVGYLNANSSKIQAFKAEVDITATQDGKSFGIDGLVACQKPQSFRLKASIFGKSGIDLGSNDDEFWYWISKADPPYLFHCAYKDLPSVKTLPFPFQPDMVIKAMGLADYDVNKCKVQTQGSMVYLIETSESPQREAIYKVTIFNRGPTSLNKPAVAGHLLMDKSSKIICRADVQSVQVDAATGAVMPSMVRFSYPAEKLDMTMRFNNLKATKYDGEQYQTMFTRRDLKIQSYDLARGLDGQPNSGSVGANNTSLQRTSNWSK